MNFKEWVEVISKYGVYFLGAIIIVTFLLAPVFNYLYKGRIEERAARISQLERQLSNLQTESSEKQKTAETQIEVLAADINEINKKEEKLKQKEGEIKNLKFIIQEPEQERDKFTLDWPLHPISRNEEYVGGTIRGFTTEELSRSKIEIYVNKALDKTRYWLVDQRQLDGNIFGTIWYQLCRFGDEIPTDDSMDFSVTAILVPKNLELPGRDSRKPLEASNYVEFKKIIRKAVMDEMADAEVLFSEERHVSRLGIKKWPCRITKILDSKGKIFMPTIPPQYYFNISPPIKLFWTDDEKEKFVEVYNDGTLIHSSRQEPGEKFSLPQNVFAPETKIPLYQIKLKVSREDIISTNIWLKFER